MSFQNGISNLQQLFTQIDPSGASAANAANAASRAGQAERSSQPAASAAGNASVDQTSLSSAAGLVGGLAAQASQTSDVRMEKVTALQQAISSGTYNVSSSDVADKIIGSLSGRGLPQSQGNG